MHTEDTFVSNFNGVDISCVKTTPQDCLKAVVLLVHGLGGQKNSETHTALIPLLTSNGIATFRFDFPGHGESGGNTLDLTIGSGGAVVDQMYKLMRTHFPSVPTGLFGASFGATAILKSHAVKETSALVIRSPVSNYALVRERQLGANKISQWKKDGRIGGLISRGRETPWRFYEEAKTLNFFHRAETGKVPLLIVQGTQDTTVPMDDTLRLFKAWAGTVELLHVEGGDHSLGSPTHTKFLVVVSGSWFVDHLLRTS